VHNKDKSTKVDHSEDKEEDALKILRNRAGSRLMRLYELLKMDNDAVMFCSTPTPWRTALRRMIISDGIRKNVLEIRI